MCISVCIIHLDGSEQCFIWKMITLMSKRKAAPEAAFGSSFTLCCSTSKCSFRCEQQIRCQQTFSLFIMALGGVLRIERFLLASVSQRLAKIFGMRKSHWRSSAAAGIWGPAVTSVSRDLGMGTSHIPNLKGFSTLCFSQRLLWNCVIPVNGFQFLGADTSHQGWFVGKLPTKSATGSQDSWFVVPLHGVFIGGWWWQR